MLSKIVAVALFIGLYNLVFTDASTHYHIAVKGALLCNNTPYRGGHIELWDYDLFYPDVKLAEQDSGLNGKFYIEGDRWELVPMVPYIQISEKCTGQLRCWKIWIPADYQWTDGNPKKVYGLGPFNITDPQVSSC